MSIDLTQNPYYDDFDPEKNFHKVLYRPSYAVQSRELTQSQTILQDQITKFGRNIFKNGSIVTGGQTTLEVRSTKYVCIEATAPDGSAIDVNNFVGSFIVDTESQGIRAYVIAGAEATVTSPTVLIVKYTSGQMFSNTLTLPIETEDGAFSANLLSSLTGFTDVTGNTIVGDASICSINDGVFFMNGYFVQVLPQTVILDAFDNSPTYRVGLQTEDSIVDETQDASLLDPAQDSTNYQAPGATRYKITLTLEKRSLTSSDDTQFIELLRVVNGELTKRIIYPTYNDLEATMARRMDDQSGSFTVRPFKIAFEPHDTFANAYNIVVEAGKAYVQGHEAETIAPEYIKSERARVVANVSQYNTTLDFQNWLEVTNLVGPIPFKTLQPAVFHCVNTASIGISNSAVAQNTTIGTGIIRALEYESGANSSSISTAVWRAYMFNANLSQSIIANCASSGSSNTMHLAPNFSPVANAYAGVKFTITTHAGATVNEHHTVGQYDGPNNLITLQGSETFAFGTPSTATQYRLDYEFKDLEALVYANTSVSHEVFSTTMDVSSSSKNAALADQYQGAFLTDTNFNSAILPLPYSYVADQTVTSGFTLSNSEYWGRKAYTAVPFTQNVATITSAAGITSIINGAISGSDAVDNILVVVRNNTGSSIGNNQVINFSSSNPAGNAVSITSFGNTSTWTITVPNMNSAASADVYVKVNLPFSDKVGGLLRTKSARIANVASGLNSGGTQMPDANNGLVQWFSQGSGTLGAQITFYANSAAWLNLKDSTKTQSVFTADVTTLRKVIDVGQNVIEDGNVAIASDITSHYTLDNGQRDNAYEHASIQLKPGFAGPTGNVVVYVDYLAHSGLGYLTVDSYASANIAYVDIPTYNSTTLGEVFALRDCIDFRPRRQDADFAGVYGEELFGISGLDFATDFSYYLARIDKVILTKDRTFEVLSGTPSLTPVAPPDKDNAMTLYTLNLPPYTAVLGDIRQYYFDNRRYTMRDIGVLEKRITNLEYYTSLSILEQTAKNQEITDDEGLTRFKNGILVDSFTGHKIGDVMNPDYECSIDSQNQELRPPYHLEALSLAISETDSTNYERTGAFITLPYTVATLVDQPLAALSINVNPFNTITWIGQIKLDPTSDVWIDTQRAPDVVVNQLGDLDNYLAEAKVLNTALQGQTIGGKTFGTQWNSWQTNWTGVSSTQKVIAPTFFGHLPGQGHRVDVYQPVIRRTTTEVTTKQTRTGIQTAYAPQDILTPLGDKVINESVIPRMRARGVIFVGKVLAPNTNLYAFFDGTAVTNYCNKTNIVKVDSTTVQYQDTYQQNESVRVWDPAGSKNTAHAIVVLSRNEPTYSNVSIINITGGDDSNIANAYFMSSTNSTFLIGASSGANTRIMGYYHNSGFVENPNTTSILLSHDVANSNVAFSNSFLAGQTIHFTSGLGLGQSATITAYNANTRNVSFTPALTVTPNTETFYSIGYFNTDYRGEVTGVFVIPSTNSVSFRTGERQFMLADTTSGDLAGSATNGIVKYFASGLLQTVQDTILATRQLTIQRTVVTDARTVMTSKTKDAVIGQNLVGWYDPLAETFLVDQKLHPSGVMITGLRLLVKTKDDNIPLQVQIRPVVNGFPHSSSVVPGSDIVVNPTEVTLVSEDTLGAAYIAGLNPLDDATMYTQVDFDGPVFLQGGAEYCVVLIANSIKYRVYIAEMGSKIIGTERLISSQPYLGTLFKSQNSTTWTPIQEQDLAFRLLYAQFDTTVTANVEFQLDAGNGISANVPLDTFYVASGNLLLPNTAIAGLFATTTADGVREENTTFLLDENVYFDDTVGRRVATSDTASFKMRFLLASLNADVSPMVDMDRLSLYAIENLVNNLELGTDIATVISSSSNWTHAENLSVAVTGGGGSGANVYLANTNINSTYHVLANISMDAVGSGYTSSPNVTITGNNTISANITFAGEDQSAGGPAIARYITRKVTLSDGMDAGDFRVYFDAYYPLNAGIDVYYKILSADDTDSFDSKGYQLMTIVQGQNLVSQNQTDIKSFVYAPGAANIAADRVQYGSFTSFKYFAIKIVMSSSDTTRVPRIRDLRVVAIPSL